MQTLKHNARKFGAPEVEVTPEQRASWQAEVRRLIALMAKHTEPYSTECAGVKLTVLPEVFSPAYFTDCEWFALEIANIVGKKSLLDIGTGTGIVAILAALKGASVTATDINPHSVENARINFEAFGIKGDVLLGDIYKPLPGNSKYDFIFWNHPFNRGRCKNEDDLSLCGFDYQYSGLKSFITDGHDWLAEGGRLLLGTSTFAEVSFIKHTAAASNLDVKVVQSRRTPLAWGGQAETELRVCEFVRQN